MTDWLFRMIRSRYQRTLVGERSTDDQGGKSCVPRILLRCCCRILIAQFPWRRNNSSLSIGDRPSAVDGSAGEFASGWPPLGRSLSAAIPVEADLVVMSSALENPTPPLSEYGLLTNQLDVYNRTKLPISHAMGSANRERCFMGRLCLKVDIC